ncbi:hypothetical protein A3F28_02715 [Candidatus Uhrbacteria bacterium RIFCSPHIGHO2_12_FULL_57_11]|uniref:AbiEi antitoxin N-terminal domain-containing protein n=3 Tax=Parcubacteria group TaxID=1794811 RepID=A0A1F7UH03_9BACT|nr:MAG: hypothetical protein A2704_04075 [Candidatus Kaiserbacteria bacterium RIFCSPHIGHO2_01_FULL_54_36b]OGL73212.1 MAG: hypothetical protein A3D72_04465 [Candidatus Uhrbacteria bacterium RIFCSPHIGHO2_02_FULL_57_19]OGL77543.1 MAG: hypothetical protein A3F28_02715 [Candidatus Uhrbacteria bacterium RIFCSPHIGHO2_12_FULL_57_11]
MAKLVNWPKFERSLKEKRLSLFTPLDVKRVLGVTATSVTFLLHRYAKKGLILRVRKGLYTLPDAHVPDPYLANRIYEPSYVSLEFALSYHGVIPESVYEITSVTTKATRRFTALGKIFSFRRIKRQAFKGYEPRKQNGFTFFIADPEKAFVDLAYLRIRANRKPLSRFHKEKINANKALRYAGFFNYDPLIRVIKTTLR